MSYSPKVAETSIKEEIPNDEITTEDHIIKLEPEGDQLDNAVNPPTGTDNAPESSLPAEEVVEPLHMVWIKEEPDSPISGDNPEDCIHGVCSETNPLKLEEENKTATEAEIYPVAISRITSGWEPQQQHLRDPLSPYVLEQERVQFDNHHQQPPPPPPPPKRSRKVRKPRTKSVVIRKRRKKGVQRDPTPITTEPSQDTSNTNVPQVGGAPDPGTGASAPSETSQRTEDKLRAQGGEDISVPTHNCQMCLKTITKTASCQEGEVTADGRSYYCERCELRVAKSAMASSKLDVQTTMVRERPYHCDVCNRRFSKLAQIQIHMRTHTGERPYQCTVCGKRFSQSSYLQTHQWTHTGEKRYCCSTCDKRFTRSSQLQIHRRIHTGEKPYPCQICDKRFSQSGNLQIHMRSHTGEKPYYCVRCSKGFTQLGSLQHHLKLHADGKR